MVAALADSERKIKVIGGRYGLSSKDTQPKAIKAVYDHLKSPILLMVLLSVLLMMLPLNH